MDKRERYRRFIDHFSRSMPEADTELTYSSPYELIVAVMLSAQCTDKRVNLITPAFFKRFPDAKILADATPEDVFPYISSCSYPNSKSRHLVGMAQMLMQDYNGQVPQGIDDLQQLPGVGRKTANVIAAVAFNQPAMPVDTHVFRVAARIGLTYRARTPLAAEKQLTASIPGERLSRAHHWLILHGRYVCTARKPKCAECEIATFCRFFEKKFRNQG